MLDVTVPEGDVVARVARRLGLALGADQGSLVRADLRWGDLGSTDLTGQRMLDVSGYGKHLLMRTDAGWTLHTHLRMDGFWRVHRTLTPPQPLRNPMIRAVLATERWTCAGHYLGMMNLVRSSDEHRVIGHLGPDLMAANPDLDTAARNLREQGERPVGAALLDQRVAAGIGTIYLAESLWEHRIDPWGPCSQVADARALMSTASFLMRRSADAVEITATGDLGQRSQVHGREGLPCRRCGDLIAVGRIGTPPQDRPAFHCPSCQVEK